MRLSRIIGSAVATLATVGAFAIAGTPAQAQPQPPYPPQPPALTVSDPTVAVGTAFTIFGSGFGGNENVRHDFSFQPLAARAPGAQPARQNSGGVGAMVPVALQAPVFADPASGLRVRANSAGEYSVRLRFNRQTVVVITATGETTGRTASTTVTIFSPQPPLPVTGSDTGPQIALGTMLLLAGVLLVLVTVAWRRRNRRAGRSRELTTVG